MGSEQFFREATMNFGFEADDSVKQRKHSNSCPEVVASEHVNGCFDCNICIESAHDPVVTLCGHLYCWPCIYKWIQVQSCSSSDSHEQPKCPVCKAYISNASLVPLYGRGMSSSESETRKRQMDNVVPHRPSALGMNSLVSHATSMSSADQQQQQPLRSDPFQQQAEPFSQQPQIQSFHQFSNPFGTTYTSMGASRYGNAAMSSLFSPMIGLFGEVVAQGMFGSSGSSSSTSLFAYAYPNSYSANGSPRRMRRQELQMEKSLGRVLSFLLCGLVLCLLLF